MTTVELRTRRAKTTAPQFDASITGRTYVPGAVSRQSRRTGAASEDVQVVREHDLAFGAAITPAVVLMHGKRSMIEHDGRGVFDGIQDPFAAGRYHSLAVAPETCPPELEVTARAADDGTIMGVRHRDWRVHGVQFHPESVLTGVGRQILRNFLEC